MSKNRYRRKILKNFCLPLLWDKILFVHFYCHRQEIIEEILRGNGWVKDL